jgi:hypothetical protein
MSLITLDQKDFAEMPTISTVAADRAYNILKITKDTYGSIVKECALNSNVPEWLIYTFMFCASGCKNLARNQNNNSTKWGYQRIGLFQATETEVVRQIYMELREQRMTQAELDYLRSLSDNWRKSLGNSASLTDVFTNVGSTWSKNMWTSPLSNNNVWMGLVNNSSASTLEKHYFDQLSLSNAEVQIAYAAIRLGKLWDIYANIPKSVEKKILLSKENKVIDKVIIEMLSTTTRTPSAGIYWDSDWQNRGAFFSDNDVVAGAKNLYNFLSKANFQYIPIPKGTGSIGISDSDAAAAADSKFSPICNNTNDLATADGIIPFNNMYTWLVTCCGQNGVIQIANSL